MSRGSSRLAELFTTSQAAQPGPLQQAPGAASRDQEEQTEPEPLLDLQLAQTRLRQQIAAIAIGVEPLGGVVGILGMHAPTQNRPELVGSTGMQVDRVQAGSERQAGADQPAVQFHLVAADQQPQFRDTDRVQGGRPEQRAVEQRRDPAQQVLPRFGAQFACAPAPYQAPPQLERQ